MANEITYAGSHRLIRAEIGPVLQSDKRRKTDISPIVHSMEIIESMANDSIRGHLQVIDMTGLLESYPLRGEERLKLRIADALGIEREYDQFIYKVDDVQPTGNNKGLAYNIHFVSYQRFLAEKKKVTRGFNLPIYGTVARLFADHYLENGEVNPVGFGRRQGEVVLDQSAKDVLIEKTDGAFRCVIPGYSAPRAMRFLAQRSYSVESPSCSFRFFESADSFYFCTIEHLFRESEKNERIFPMTHVEMLQRDHKNIVHQIKNLTSVTNPKRFDTFDDIHSGAYNSKVVELDILNKRINNSEEGFDYIKHRNSFYKPSDGEDFNTSHTDDFANEVFTDDNGRKFLLIKDYTNDVGGQLSGDQFIPQIVKYRTSYMAHLNSMAVNATGYGRMDITCGDVIDFGMPEINSNTKNIDKNKQMSGKYVVESLVRTFQHDEYTNHYRLLKKDMDEVIDNRIVHKLRTGLGGF